MSNDLSPEKMCEDCGLPILSTEVAVRRCFIGGTQLFAHTGVARCIARLREANESQARCIAELEQSTRELNNAVEAMNLRELRSVPPSDVVKAAQRLVDCIGNCTISNPLTDTDVLWYTRLLRDALKQPPVEPNTSLVHSELTVKCCGFDTYDKRGTRGLTLEVPGNLSITIGEEWVIRRAEELRQCNHDELYMVNADGTCLLCGVDVNASDEPDSSHRCNGCNVDKFHCEWSKKRGSHKCCPDCSHGKPLGETGGSQ